MQGLLGNWLPEDPDKRDAAKMGLLNFGAAMLANANQGFGGALGSGLLTGTHTYQDARNDAQRRRMQGLQFDQMQLQTDQARREAATNEAIVKAGQESMRTPAQMSMINGQGPTLANAANIPNTQPSFDTSGFLNRVMAVDPLKGLSLQASMAKETPFNKVDPKDYTPESVARFAQTRSYGDLVPARKLDVVNNQAVDLYNTKPGTQFDNVDPNQPFWMRGGQVVPNTPYQGFAITKAQAGAAKNNIDARTINTQESEQSKVYGKSLGEIRSGITTAAFEAPSTMAKLDRLEELLKDVGTGSDAAVKLAQGASTFGLNIDPKLGNKEAAAAITRELAGTLRKPGTGTSTDADFENFMQQVPSLSQTPEGRAQVITTMRAKAARDIEIAKLAREYASRRNGVIDDGFMDIVSDYVAKNPVVQRASTSGRDNIFPDVNAIEAELASRQKAGR